MRYTLTLDLDIADSLRSSSDTTRRARDAAAKITDYAGRLRFVTRAEMVVPGGLKRNYDHPDPPPADLLEENHPDA